MSTKIEIEKNMNISSENISYEKKLIQNKTDEDIFKCKALYLFPPMGKGIEEFEDNFDFTHYRTIHNDVHDVEELMLSIINALLQASETKDDIPLWAKKNMEGLSAVTCLFIKNENYEIELLLEIFEDQIKSCIKNKKIVEACTYVMRYMREFISNKYKKKTTKIPLEGSEKKMNVNTCKYKELHKSPDLHEALEVFENNYNFNHYRTMEDDFDDVVFLLSSIQEEIKAYVPMDAEQTMTFIKHIITRLMYDENDIEGLLRVFKDDLKAHVTDKETVEACNYVLSYVSDYESNLYINA